MGRSRDAIASKNIIVMENFRVKFGNTISCRIRPAKKGSELRERGDRQVWIKCFRAGSVLGTNLLTSTQVHTYEASIISTLSNITSMSYDGKLDT